MSEEVYCGRKNTEKSDHFCMIFRSDRALPSPNIKNKLHLHYRYLSDLIITKALAEFKKLQ